MPKETIEDARLFPRSNCAKREEIAEEVAEVYPDLVVRNKEGQVETVQYQKLTPMLLNEVQKLHHELRNEQDENREQQRKIEALEAKLAGMSALEARLKALEAVLSTLLCAYSRPQRFE